MPSSAAGNLVVDRVADAMHLEDPVVGLRLAGDDLIERARPASPAAAAAPAVAAPARRAPAGGSDCGVRRRRRRSCSAKTGLSGVTTGLRHAAADLLGRRAHDKGSG